MTWNSEQMNQIKTLATYQSGAEFSSCRNYRYALWRIWDLSKPLVMFIGLNPSKANESEPDPTIKSVVRIALNNGYGGIYMMNCYPLVSTDPVALKDFHTTPFHDVEELTNRFWLEHYKSICKDVVFAWGNFKIVREYEKDKELAEMFPNAMALQINKNGSPKHPLYCKSNTQFIKYI